MNPGDIVPLSFNAGLVALSFLIAALGSYVALLAAVGIRAEMQDGEIRIGYIIIGAIAGWIAGKIVKGSGSGILMNIVIGIVGALIGGFLLSFFLDTAGGGWWFTLFTAILGSVILLWIVGKVQGRSRV